MSGNTQITKDQEVCQDRAWKTHYEPTEVSSSDLAGHSLCTVFNRLGITGEAKKKDIQSTSEAVEKDTRWLRIKKSELWEVAAEMRVRD